MSNKPSWQSQHFAEQDTDPLAGFANIMDVMLVFALGLMLALIAQSPELRDKLNINTKNEIKISTGDELIDAPDSIEEALKSNTDGMQPLGQVYQDPKTGKLILIKTE